ncbi:hypothetical protein RFI_14280 [Reticulomyxa filosa]|uniref:Uncharacterized protein n=1 Tax=Reticulomyxa filosa TaxID=46433 RepID=X6N9F3_RETFI|nr:hypothetical protein RFI_14280 [Reticulomyxa filosa]|eukprot:ETO22910.1 hypothetical protein RFI_14280 [Reticulomyxa filosa]
MQVIKQVLYNYFAGTSQQNPQIIVNSTNATIILTDKSTVDNAFNYFKNNQTFLQDVNNELQQENIQSSVKVMAVNIVEGDAPTDGNNLTNNADKAGHSKYWVWIVAIATVLSAIALFAIGLLGYMYYRQKKKHAKNIVVLAKGQLSSKKIAARKSRLRELRISSLSNDREREKTTESSVAGALEISSIESRGVDSENVNEISNNQGLDTENVNEISNNQGLDKEKVRRNSEIAPTSDSSPHMTIAKDILPAAEQNFSLPTASVLSV